VLFYRAALPLSSRTLTVGSGIIGRHRISIGSPRRTLNPGPQALLVLVYLRKGETSAELATGSGAGTTTAWRYASETAALLAARAPKPRTAARDAKKTGHACAVVDGRADPGRPGRRGPAVLPRQAPQARHELAGHRQFARRDRVGVRGAAQIGTRQQGRHALSWWPGA
jgi:hypothetical protein